MRSMEYLKKAEAYAEAQGDWIWFCHYYSFYREHHDVLIAAQRALWQLYGDWNIIPIN